MKLPNSKVYWADFLSYSAILSDKEICQVLKNIAIRAMSYDNPQDTPQDTPQDLKQKQIQKQIQKLNKIQLDFYNCLAKAQDESAKDYIASVMNGRKGGRPKKQEKQELNENQKIQNTETETINRNKDNITTDESLIRYGQFKNVLLTNDFYIQLINTQGIEKVNYGIEKLDSWLDKEKQKNKRNQNHRGYFKVNSWVWDGAPESQLKRIDPPVSLDDLDFTR